MYQNGGSGGKSGRCTLSKVPYNSAFLGGRAGGTGTSGQANAGGHGGRGGGAQGGAGGSFLLLVQIWGQHQLDMNSFSIVDWKSQEQMG